MPNPLPKTPSETGQKPLINQVLMRCHAPLLMDPMASAKMEPIPGFFDAQRRSWLMQYWFWPRLAVVKAVSEKDLILLDEGSFRDDEVFRAQTPVAVRFSDYSDFSGVFFFTRIRPRIFCCCGKVTDSLGVTSSDAALEDPGFTEQPRWPGCNSTVAGILLFQFALSTFSDARCCTNFPFSTWRTRFPLFVYLVILLSWPGGLAEVPSVDNPECLHHWRTRFETFPAIDQLVVLKSAKSQVINIHAAEERQAPACSCRSRARSNWGSGRHRMHGGYDLQRIRASERCWSSTSAGSWGSTCAGSWGSTCAGCWRTT